MKAYLKAHLPVAVFVRLKTLLDTFVLRYRNYTWSQFGEDVLLNDIFRQRDGGFYVDVGAYHPCQFSNTWRLYKKGWRGINIDASPESMALFRRIRRRDINLNQAVSDEAKALPFYSWGLSSENSLSPLQVNALIHEKGAPWKVVELRTMPLGEILDRYLPEGEGIDLLCVDVEGNDLSVLKSNNWDKYKPSVIVVELFADSIDTVLESELYQYLADRRYRLTHWPAPSLIFQRSRD